MSREEVEPIRAPLFTPTELYRYFVVSFIALGVDAGILFALTGGFGIHYLLANAVAFLTGTLIAYVGSVRWVFASRRVANRGLECFIFALIGLGGLIVNEIAIWFGFSFLGLHLALAKAGAAGASFSFNFLVRKLLLFR